MTNGALLVKYQVLSYFDTLYTMIGASKHSSEDTQSGLFIENWNVVAK